MPFQIIGNIERRSFGKPGSDKMTVEEAVKTIRDGRIVEFSYHGCSYLIQQENNKSLF